MQNGGTDRPPAYQKQLSIDSVKETDESNSSNGY